MPRTLSLLAVLKKVDAKGVKSLSNAQWNTFLASDTEPDEIEEKIKRLEGYEEKGAAYDATGELIVEDNQVMIDRFSKRTGRAKGRQSFKVKKTKINVGEFLGKDRTPDKSQNPEISFDDEEEKGDVGPKGMETKVGRLSRILRDTRGRVLKLEEENKKKSSKKLVTEGLDDTISLIAEKVNSIEGTLKEQIKIETENVKLQKQKLEDEKRDSEESRLGKVTGFLKGAAKKIIAPVQNIFGQLFGFIKRLILGKIFLNILKWFGNPANAGKIDSVIKFLGNNWKKLLSLYIVFGTGLGRFVRWITKVAIRGAIKLAALSARLLAAKGLRGAGAAAAWLGGPKGKVLGTVLTVGSGLLMTAGVNNMLGGDGDDEPQKFNKGGKVRGQGDRDTVPAMLTPGEFVMSKGAVQKYGIDTMESMNAAAGGTNVPILMPNKKRKGYKDGAFVELEADQQAFIQEGIEKARQVATDYANAAPGRELDPLVNFAMDQMKTFYGITNTKAGVVTDPDGTVRMQSQQELNEENNAKLPMGLKMTEDGQNIDLGKAAADKVRMISQVAEDPKYAERLKELGKEYGFENMNAEQLREIADEEAFNLQTSVNKFIPGTESHTYDVIANQINQSTAQRMAGGGLVPYVQHLAGGGGPLTQEEADAMANDWDNRPEARMQRLRDEQAQIRPGPNGKFSKQDSDRMYDIIVEIQEIQNEIIASRGGTTTPTTPTTTPPTQIQTPSPSGSGGRRLRTRSGGGLDFKRIAGGLADYATLGMFDFDNKNRKGAPKDFGIRRIVGGLADHMTMGLTDFDKRGSGLLQFNPLFGGEDKAWGAADEQSKRGESQSGFGLKRGVGGVMDQMTGNLFDFDNESGGGLLRKTANAIAGLFGKGKGDDLVGKGDKVMGKEPKIEQIEIPAEGLESILIKISSNQNIKTPVGQPSLSGPKITVIPENKSINTPTDSGQADGGKSIPKFSVGYGSARKAKQLGISR